MGKKKAAARGGVSKRTPSKGLSETGLEAVADDAYEQMEEAEAAAAIAGGGARTVNPELQKRLDLLAELSRRGDIRGFVRVFVPHDLTQDDTDYFAGELEGDETRWFLDFLWISSGFPCSSLGLPRFPLQFLRLSS